MMDSVAQLQEIVREKSYITVRAGGTKTALCANANVEIAGLSGVVEYEPSEYTFTARAGTRLSEIEQLLARHGQFMPFDPVMVSAGATIGGAIASGISGPGRFRYGGLRDFLLGLLLVNGEGQIVRGGGKVVKNAAGFDIPKLIVGSLGRFGIVTEATFKVFPRPESYATAIVDYTGTSALDAALDDMLRVATSPAEAACLDLQPPGRLMIRVGGIATALPKRIDRIKTICRGTLQISEGDEDRKLWESAREIAWRASDQRLVRIPIAPSDIPQLERTLCDAAAGPRRYSVGGNLLWLCWPATSEWTTLEHIVRSIGRSAQIVIGECERPLLNHSSNVFSERLLSIFDPHHKFSAPKSAATTGTTIH